MSIRGSLGATPLRQRIGTWPRHAILVIEPLAHAMPSLSTDDAVLRLVRLDNLYECSNPEKKRPIRRAFAGAFRNHAIPFRVLIISRPELLWVIYPIRFTREISYDDEYYYDRSFIGPIVHWDRCSNLQVTDDWEKNCSHHKVNPKIIGHRGPGYLFFGGAAFWVYQLVQAK